MRRPDVPGDAELQSSVLESLAGAERYRQWLAELATPWLGRHPLEVGSGLGDYAEHWSSHCERLTVSEADATRLEHLRKRFAGDLDIVVEELQFPVEVDASYSSVVAYNVLEHIPDDLGALRSFRSLLDDRGHLIILVPAFAVAMSKFDREIGHERRYTKHSLRAVAEAAGFEVLRLRYVNPVGLIAWIVLMRFLGRRPSNGPLIRKYDRYVVPLLRWFDRIDPPFGQSVFMVARPASDGERPRR